MKKEDIERLKEICEKEGFEALSHQESNLFTITKKDPFDGVEFAKCIHEFSPFVPAPKLGRIYPVKVDFSGGVTTIIGPWGNVHSKNFTPSTEAEYVEQLKKEAFKRFGEIKSGDKFERSWTRPTWQNPAVIDNTNRGFSYNKGYDQLSFKGTVIYESGKWATKLEKMVKVEANLYYKQLDDPDDLHVFAFKIENLKDGYSVAQVNHFLEKQLESYLNNETKD